MATFVLTDATVLQGSAWTGTAPGPGDPTISGTISSSTDWSDHIKSLSTNNRAAMVDFNNFGAGGFEESKPGLKGADLSIEFYNDFAASNVDATFGAAVLAGTLLYFDVKPTSSARGSTNPSYVYAAYVESYTPASGSVGDAAGATVGLKVTGKYARLTS